MNVPTDRRYTETHEWFLADGDMVTMGITQFAADELTDITFVELPEIGRAIAPGDTIGEVESVKAVSDVYAPVTGKIKEVNDELPNSPEAMNQEPYGDGWMVIMELSHKAELEDLMTADDYTTLVNELS